MNGNNVRFWANALTGDLGPLCNLDFCPFSEHEMNFKVCDMPTNEGNWNWSSFKDKIPISSLFHIAVCCVNRS